MVVSIFKLPYLELDVYYAEVQRKDVLSSYPGQSLDSFKLSVEYHVLKRYGAEARFKDRDIKRIYLEINRKRLQELAWYISPEPSIRSVIARHIMYKRLHLDRRERRLRSKILAQLARTDYDQLKKEAKANRGRRIMYTPRPGKNMPEAVFGKVTTVVTDKRYGITYYRVLGDDGRRYSVNIQRIIDENFDVL